MDIPREIYDVWKQVADKFFQLHNGTDEDRREATRRGVATIRARFRGQSGVLDGTRWVCKTEHGTGWNAQSKDALAYVAPDFGPAEHGRFSKMFMFDMIDGGTRRTNSFPITAKNFEESPPNPDAYILIPEEKDWLAGEEPPPPPPPDCTEWVAEAQRLAAELTAMTGQRDAALQELTEAKGRIVAQLSEIERLQAEVERLKQAPCKLVNAPGWLVRMLDIKCVRG